MRICKKLRIIAVIQKAIGWSFIFMAARYSENLQMMIIGCALGIFLAEAADMWYRLTFRGEKILRKRKERFIKVGKP